MPDWTEEELERIGGADELAIVTFRRDGSARKPVPIWVVRDGNGLYVRSGHARAAAWFRAVLTQRHGRISAGGIERDVSFQDADPASNDRIDVGYRTKYRHYGAHYITMVTSRDARATTMRLVLQGTMQ